VFSSSELRLRSAISKLQSLLVAGENIEHLATQVHIFALINFNRRVIIAATSMRMIIFKRGLLGGYGLTDIRWQDLENVNVSEFFFENIFGASFTIKIRQGSTVIVNGVQSAQVRPLYVYSQQQEQSWREKNRIRKIEEDRAKAGGITLGNSTSMTNPTPTPHAALGEDTVMLRIQKAKALFEQGLMSDDEYEAIKARIFNEL
jgi:Bacterial PH domain/Short C-terminal domain